VRPGRCLLFGHSPLMFPSGIPEFPGTRTR
jgi:hypothetical protein